jgi:alpha-maltose-1-phosphate synthase
VGSILGLYSFAQTMSHGVCLTTGLNEFNFYIVYVEVDVLMNSSKDYKNNELTKKSKTKELNKCGPFSKGASTILLMDSDGLSNYTCYLARGLSKYRDIILYGFSEESFAMTGAALEKRVKFYYIKEGLPKGYSTLRGIIRVILLFFILFTILIKKKYDIVHVQEHMPMFFLFIPLLKAKRKKIFWTLHDVEIFYPSNDIHGKLQVLFLKTVSQPALMTRFADKIVVHASSLKEQLISKKVNQNKIHVIPHFDYGYLLDDNNNAAHKIPYHGILPEEYGLFFGNIAPWKGIDILIQAAKIVAKRIGTKFNLVIAGKPYEGYEDIPYYESLTKEDYRYIHIINKFIESSEIPCLISKSRFLILPYTGLFQHSASGVIPLAYTFSKPVIVSNVASLAEYVDHEKTGLIFEAGNSTQLAEYIIELMENDNKLKEMGNEAHKKMLKEMSLERCCVILNGLYELG